MPALQRSAGPSNITGTGAAAIVPSPPRRGSYLIKQNQLRFLYRKPMPLKTYSQEEIGHLSADAKEQHLVSLDDENLLLDLKIKTIKERIEDNQDKLF